VFTDFSCIFDKAYPLRVLNGPPGIIPKLRFTKSVAAFNAFFRKSLFKKIVKIFVRKNHAG